MSLLTVTRGTATTDSMTTGADWDFASPPGYMVTEAAGSREKRTRTVGMSHWHTDGRTRSACDDPTGYIEPEKRTVRHRLPT